jgi:hypothetical protein
MDVHIETVEDPDSHAFVELVSHQIDEGSALKAAPQDGGPERWVVFNRDHVTRVEQALSAVEVADRARQPRPGFRPPAELHPQRPVRGCSGLVPRQPDARGVPVAAAPDYGAGSAWLSVGCYPDLGANLSCGPPLGVRCVHCEEKP